MSVERIPWVMVALADAAGSERMAQSLRPAGHEVACCDSAGSAIEAVAARNMPALAILDLALPDRRKWLKALRSGEAGKGRNGPPLLAVAALESDAPAAEADSVLKANGFLRLPCSDDCLANVVEALLMHANSSAYRPLVLVVDDSPEMRNILNVSMSAHGFRFLEATTGAEALECARANAPDVIVLDHILPDASGLALMPELQSGRDPTIIVITGDPTASLAEDYTRLGATAFVRKPFGVSLLIEMIGNLCRGQVPGHGAPEGNGIAADAFSRKLEQELRQARESLARRDCRIADMEREVNELLLELGRPARYPAAP